MELCTEQTQVRANIHSHENSSQEDQDCLMQLSSALNALWKKEGLEGRSEDS